MSDTPRKGPAGPRDGLAHTQFGTAPSMQTRHFERWLLRHPWLRTAASGLARWGLTLLLYPRFVAPYRWRLRRLPMALPNLGPGFAGYKILFLSDLHAGRTRPGHLQRVLQTLALERPDAILLGGDLIEYCLRSVPALAEILPYLHAPDGVYAVFGNHDYREMSHRHIGARSAKRAIHKRLVNLLTQSHVRLLRNELVTIRRGPDALQIVGVDEIWSKQAEGARAFAAAQRGVPTICLLHNPDGYEEVAPYGWDWMLCGHTHGGQVDLPILGPMYVPMRYRERLRGCYAFPGAAGRERRTMYVSTGIGYSTPVRFRAPPEAVVFTLVPG